MAGVRAEVIQELKASLSNGAVVLTPSEEGYKESITRWAVSSERNAVCHILPQCSLP